MKGKKGAYFMIVLTLMLFFILSYMYYLFYIDVDTKHIYEVGFIGDKITEGENSLDREILIFEKNVDIAVYVALEELANRGGVSLECNNIWNKLGCEPTDEVVFSEFQKLFTESLTKNLEISKINADSTFLFRLEDNKIRLGNEFLFKFTPEFEDKKYSLLIERTYRFDKIYDYDLGIYYDTYVEFKDDNTVTDNHRLTHFRLVDPDIHYKFERPQLITSAENKPTS